MYKRQLLDSLGGYVENLYEYGDVESGDTRTASLSMRVPSENLDAFLDGMEGVGRVTDRSESVTDMTVQYTDNQTRLETLYAKRERLNQLMAQAQEVSDLIELETAVADTQYEIERYETSQRDIDRRVDMSDVNVTLLEESPAQSATAEDIGLGEMCIRDSSRTATRMHRCFFIWQNLLGNRAGQHHCSLCLL